MDQNDPLVWNNLKTNDMLRPRVFLCKAGKFLERMNEKMGGDGVRKERFGSDDFQETCDPSRKTHTLEIASESIESASENDENLDPRGSRFKATFTNSLCKDHKFNSSG